MAPKRKYDAARLEAAAVRATEAGEKEVRKVHAEEFELKCSYVASDAKIKKNTVVDFEWHIVIDGFDERHITQIKCDTACDRKVPFPEHWRTAVR